MSKKCSIVGDINIDVITPPFQFPENIGETSIVLDDFKVTLGGNAANFAVELAVLQSAHEFHGAIGDCAISHWIIDFCNQHKMNYNLTKIPNQSAGITFAMTFLEGKRQFVATLGTNKLLDSTHLDMKKIMNGDHLYRAGFWYTPKLLGYPTISMMKEMITKGGQTSLDFGWDPDNFTEEHIEILFKTIEFTSILFANEKEIAAITKKTKLEDGLACILDLSTHLDDQIIVVHQGSNGSLIRTKKREIQISTKEVPQNNPTGTGDIYNAGFIYGVLNDWDLEKCGRFADNLACVHLENRNKPYPSIIDL